MAIEHDTPPEQTARGQADALSDSAGHLLSNSIARPELWRLALKIEPGMLHVVLHSTVEDGSLLTRRIPLATEGTTAVKALEEAVYDNPLLMARFADVSIVIVSDTFLACPDEVADDEAAHAMMAALYPNDALIDNILINRIEGLGAAIAYTVPEELLAFVRRTFDNPTIWHPLAVLARYFSLKSKAGNSRKMYAHFDGERMNVLSFTRQGLSLANTYRMHSADDAAYYLLATRRLLGLSATDDELLMVGDATTRQAVERALRDYHQRMLPVIFPTAMFQAGRHAINAPFDLIILPLL